MKRIAAAGALIVVAMLGWVGHGTMLMNDKLDLIADQKEKLMPTSNTVTWKSAYGMQSITTYRGANETPEAWAARTLVEVKAMQAVFPVVP